MKQKHKPHISMRLFFTIYVIVELLIIIVISSALVTVLHTWIDITYQVPDVIYLIVLSACLGCAITNFLGKAIFAPITKLGEAMHRVAAGDFTIRLDETKGFREIRQINADFNLMVKELGATEILQTDFVSNVSHEFKTPINAIEGYVTLLQGCEQPLSAEQAEYAKEIQDNTRRLSSLVGNVLLLSKLDNQNIPAPKSKYRLDEQIRQVILSLEQRWTEKGTDFDVDMDSIEYTGNEKLLFHVWSNLIDNAVKFGPQNGMIRITLCREGEHTVFTIDDEGPGIHEEDQLHIFDRFYQADSSHKEEGNGLGLSMVKQILQSENGKIAVQNLDLGGCRFIVTL